MRRLFSTFLIHLMLVLFVTSQGYWSFGSKWLMHELDHERNPEVLAIEQRHVATEVNGLDMASDDNQLADTEHSLLHAAGHLQPFSLPVAAIAYPFFVGIAVVVIFFFVSPPASRHIERLFRPPRTLY